jgi:hypothetical protein
MTYRKPTVVALGAAIDCVQIQFKPQPHVFDPDRRETNTAYEADE